MNHDSGFSTRPPTQSEIDYSCAVEQHCRRIRLRAWFVTVLLALSALGLAAVAAWGLA